MTSRRPTGHLALALSLVATACQQAPPLQPAGWDDGIRLAAVTDEDPDPQVVQVALEARLAEVEIRPGTRTTAWTYNGSLPGPLLRARVGQTLVVRFTNHLPAATTIHWHGVRVPNPMDGSEVSQTPVPAGGSFEYRFLLRDAGTFWYHSHVDSSAQVGHGLYGMLLVDEDRPLDESALPLVFSDISLADDGSILPGDEDGALGAYFGREGNVLLLNGRPRPSLRAYAKVPQRWHVVNAARARFLQLHIPGATVQRVGGDGGALPHPEAVSSSRLMPGERATLQVTFSTASASPVIVESEDANRFHLPTMNPPTPLLDVQVDPPPRQPPDSTPPDRSPIAPLDVHAATERSLLLGDGSMAGMPVLTINGLPSWSQPPLHIPLGSTEVWRVTNNTDFDHPIHLHGYFFQVLDRDGKPWPQTEWKDTVELPRRTDLRFAVAFDERPGSWMFHCHILDHVELGMMLMLMVE